MTSKLNYKNYLEEGNVYVKKIDSLIIAEEKVAWLMHRFPKLRDNDKLLIFYYWKHMDGFEGYLDDQRILSLTSSGTITRVRRRIQNEYGLFLPKNEEVIRARKISQTAVRDWSVNRINR